MSTAPKIKDLDGSTTETDEITARDIDIHVYNTSTFTGVMHVMNSKGEFNPTQYTFDSNAIERCEFSSARTIKVVRTAGSGTVELWPGNRK